MDCRPRNILSVLTTISTRSPRLRPSCVLEVFRGLADGAILINSKNPSQRLEAAWRLGRKKVKEAVPSLIKALDDPDQIVRGMAAWALGEIGDRAAIDPLIDSLEKHIAME